ncbi:MAG: MBL fold metallo-hydrolase, partial [Pseudomonadota bacterium]
DDFDDPVFPNARYAMSAAEQDWWSDPATLGRLPENRQVFASAAKRLIGALDGQLERFSPGDEVAPGVEALSTPGHTPGHCSFILHSGADSAIVLGDVVVDEAVSFARPAQQLRGDMDPALAAVTRHSLLQRLVAERTLLSGFHLTRGGLGYASLARDTTFQFEPV